MIRPDLSFVAGLAADVADETMQPREALAILQRRRLNPDPVALEDAVNALRMARDFRDHWGDPYDFLGGSVRAGVDAWEEAARVCDAEAEDALRVLNVRTRAVA